MYESSTTFAPRMGSERPRARRGSPSLLASAWQQNAPTAPSKIAWISLAPRVAFRSPLPTNGEGKQERERFAVPLQRGR